MTPQYKIVLADIGSGLLDWRMWGRLGWQETKRRYRRTVLGPFWTTLSLGVFIFSLGFVWANLWRQDPKTYLPFLTSGMLIWSLISTIITEGCQTFTSYQELIKSFQFNYTVLACAVIWRNIIVLLHNLLILGLVGLYAGMSITLSTFLVAPGLLLVFINGMWVCTVLGLACTRFRDIPQIVGTILQVSMLITPIFWTPEQLGPRFLMFVDFNFLFHFVDIVRSPLLGRAPSHMSWTVALASTVVGWGFTIWFFSRFRRRIPYWM
jgi:ABC-type polysaccharide/polyol phosphate export permease